MAATAASQPSARLRASGLACARRARAPQLRRGARAGAGAGAGADAGADADPVARLRALQSERHPEGTPEERVAQLGLELDGRVPTNPQGIYHPVVRGRGERGEMHKQAQAHAHTRAPPFCTRRRLTCCAARLCAPPPPIPV